MPFHIFSSASKLAKFREEDGKIEAALAADRKMFPEIWDRDRIIGEVRTDVIKNPTRENVPTLLRLDSQERAAVAALQLLAAAEQEKRCKLRLSLRSLAHGAADEVEGTLKKRLASVKASDATASAELGRPFVSTEVIMEIDRRLGYLETARQHLDRGEVGEAVGAIEQAAA